MHPTSSYQVGQSIQLADARPGRIVSIHHTHSGTELVVSIDTAGRQSTIRNLHVSDNGTLTDAQARR